MKILYFANGVRGESCLKALIDHGEDLAGVVIEPGKGSSIAGLAKSHNLPVYEPAKVNDAAFIDQVEEIRPDLGILSGYTGILKKKLISVPKKGFINLHGGKLPHYRGAAPINWQILRGETRLACTIIEVDEGIDTGAILAEKEYEIKPDENASAAVRKSLEIFPGLLLETLEKIKSGTLSKKPQNPKEGKYFRRRKPEDGIIDWNQLNAMEIHNLIRALVKPYPGAFTHKGKEKIVIWKSSLYEGNATGRPGEVLQSEDAGALVMAKDKPLLICEISVGDSKQSVNAAKHFKPGDQLKGTASGKLSPD